MNIKNLTLEQKKLMLYVLETELGMKATDTEAKVSLEQIEMRKCNEIAELKRAGKSVVMTEYQF
jgi:hypothetical protein